MNPFHIVEINLRLIKYLDLLSFLHFFQLDRVCATFQNILKSPCQLNGCSSNDHLLHRFKSVAYCNRIVNPQHLQVKHLSLIICHHDLVNVPECITKYLDISHKRIIPDHISEEELNRVIEIPSCVKTLTLVGYHAKLPDSLEKLRVDYFVNIIIEKPLIHLKKLRVFSGVYLVPFSLLPNLESLHTRNTYPLLWWWTIPTTVHTLSIFYHDTDYDLPEHIKYLSFGRSSNYIITGNHDYQIIPYNYDW